MSKKAVIIGGGFAGLSTAVLLSHQGYTVTLLEKNNIVGGRAREWKNEGFTFDMGPSWYLMPEVFDDFFTYVGKKREDYFALKRLTHYYKVFFENSEPVIIGDNIDTTKNTFDSFENRGGQKLTEYLKQAEYKYNVAMKEFLYKEYRSVFQFLKKRMLTEGLKMHMFTNLDRFAGKYFSDIRSKQIIEYAMVFLGTNPKDAPALYSIMSHVDLNLGVYYPEGGLAGAALGFKHLAEELGATILTNKSVTGYLFDHESASKHSNNNKYTKNNIRAVQCGDEIYEADVVVNSADYQYAETNLLPPQKQTYTNGYWKKRVVAPSMFIVYLGINRRLENLEHHNLYFSQNWDAHFDKIFKKPGWPDDPCFYLSCNSKTDPTSAPQGCENVFILVPVAPGLDDNNSFREIYAEKVLKHIEHVTGENLHKDVIVKRIFSHTDFISDYNAYKGTALSLAHTLFQTAVFRPSHQSRKVANLFYTGHYTHPGVGVPMTLIASRIVADEIEKMNRILT